MPQHSIASLSRAQINRETTLILSRSGNRQRLILATLIAASPMMLYVFAATAFVFYVLPVVSEDLFACASGIFGLALSLLTIFLVFPLLTGLLYLAERMEAGEETVLADLFHAFTGRKAYRAAVTLSLGAAWRIAVFVCVEGVLEALGQRFFGKDPFMWTLMAILMLATGILMLFLFLGGFGKPYAIFRGSGAGRRGRVGTRAMGVRYWIGFLPGLLLSALSFLIYLIADLLPRMLVFYFRFCRKAEETGQQSTIQPEESL